MKNTKHFDFSVKVKTDIKDIKNFVILQAGKGKKANSVIYVNSIEFSYIEGLIWSKFREYRQTSKKTSISSNDWIRILASFNKGIEDISNYKLGDNIKELLEFDLINPTNPLEDVLNSVNGIAQLLNQISEWIQIWFEVEKKILIIKN